MEESSRADVIRSNPNYVYRTIAGQHVLVSIGEELADFRGYIELNETASFLWEQLQKGRTREELLRSLTESFDVDEERAARDLDNCLKFLSERGMIR